MGNDFLFDPVNSIGNYQLLFSIQIKHFIFNAKLTHRNLRPNKANKIIGTNMVGIIYKKNSHDGWANQLRHRSRLATVSDNMAIVSRVANHINTIKLEHFKHDIK